MSAIRRFINHNLGYCEVQFDTTKTSTASSNSTSLTLTFPGVVFTSPFTIYWGDGASTYVSTSGSNTHIYASPGTYLINIIGDDFKLFFANSGDLLKIGKIVRWANLRMSSSSFYGCQNLDLSSTEGIPIIDTNLSSAFRGILRVPFVVNNIELWDVSQVINMENMLASCFGFTQDISSWNFNKNVRLNGFLLNKSVANFSVENYSKFLIKLESCVVNTGRTETLKQLSAGNCKRNSSATPAYNSLIADGWTINDAGLI